MLIRKMGTVALAAGMGCFSAFGALAQHQDQGTTASPLTIPGHPPPPSTLTDQEQGYFFNLTPYGAQIGQDLADRGIYITGRTLEEGIGAASGGFHRGTFYEGYTSLGTDLDMGRIAGIQGGSVHILFDDLSGAQFQTYSGSTLVYNRVLGMKPAFRLNEFSYEQNFGKLDVRVGRVPIGPEFDYSEANCQFIYAMCALPVGYGNVRGAPTYATASWAAVAQYRFTRNFYVNAGAYEDEPLLNLSGHLNMPGEDWAPDKFRGVTLPVQIGYRESMKQTMYPFAVDIGGFYDTGDYTDLLLNSAGQIHALSGGAQQLDHGKSGMWLQGQKVLFRPEGGESQRNLMAFGGLNFTTSGVAAIQRTAYAGMSYTGLLPNRPNDTLNFMGMYIGLSDSFVDNVDATLRKNGILGSLNSSEAYVELNYGVALAPGVVLKPSFDYIFNPDQLGVAHPVDNLHHAMFIGLALSAFWPETFGLPRLGG
ncbi:MAG: carbohydrate porin [Methylovirgula sp.]|uniref:carbohydrate porin n=1 Tax=Methylovirgula sp. TaxID=1978224 RepID=UPI0030767D20